MILKIDFNETSKKAMVNLLFKKIKGSSEMVFINNTKTTEGLTSRLPLCKGMCLTQTPLCQVDVNKHLK